KDQLGQIVPRGGIVFTVGEALVVAALAVVLVGVGVRRTRRLAEAKATPARAAAASRGVIATSATAAESGERFVGGVRVMWRRPPHPIWLPRRAAHRLRHRSRPRRGAAIHEYIYLDDFPRTLCCRDDLPGRNGCLDRVEYRTGIQGSIRGLRTGEMGHADVMAGGPSGER